MGQTTVVAASAFAREMGGGSRVVYLVALHDSPIHDKKEEELKKMGMPGGSWTRTNNEQMED